MPDVAAVRPSALVLAGLLLSACAGTPNRADGPADPLEPVNRPIYQFNDTLDRNVLRPVARGYDGVVPGPINRGISNFFDNIDDVAVLFNTALQLKPRAAGITAGRLLVNTTIGLAGFIDVADKMGAKKQDEDFGQTLGHWGVANGAYLVLPLLGPSTLRDGTGILVDGQLDPVDLIEDDAARLTVEIVRVVDRRAGLLGASDVLDTAAIDPYEFTRDAYLRRRVDQVHDGDPPPEALPGSGSGDDDEQGFDPFSDEDDDLFQEQ